ncbi:hypothetical protein DID88_006352 [Monilinia fructigena]|uniref:Uncharacterized protein n=1 Tax=Monilinia fructigena TaxID=38457 RepID=A0A395J3E8_9HELO|nr:hypothetical protein DID88_006352 [Monilinia fructigena]
MDLTLYGNDLALKQVLGSTYINIYKLLFLYSLFRKLQNFRQDYQYLINRIYYTPKSYQVPIIALYPITQIHAKMLQTLVIVLICIVAVIILIGLAAFD